MKPSRSRKRVAHVVWEEHLVSEWQRIHSRDSFGYAQDRAFDAPSVGFQALIPLEWGNIRSAATTPILHCGPGPGHELISAVSISLISRGLAASLANVKVPCSFISRAARSEGKGEGQGAASSGCWAFSLTCVLFFVDGTLGRPARLFD